MIRAKIVSTGLYAPPRVETAAELAPQIGRSERWILQRTGVARRHVAEEPVEVMGAKAARDAMGDGPAPDALIYASATPRQAIPDTSCFVARELGLDGLTTFTVHATCLSFLAALLSASTLVVSGGFRRVLIVCSEFGTRGRDFREPESAALFGDGAAAAIVEATPLDEASALLGFSMATYPAGAELTELRAGGVFRHPLDPQTQPEDALFHMDGAGVYRFAVPRMAFHLQAAFEQAGITGPDEIDLAVPHQASARALAGVAKYVGFPPSRIVNVIGEYGNCVAASLPMALAHAEREGRLRRGARVLLAGSGAGLSVGAAVLRW